MSINTLYVLTNLPTSIVRKIWYYTGAGTQIAKMMLRKILFHARLEQNSQWFKTHTFWSIGRTNIEATIFGFQNSSRLPIHIWCELRIVMLNILKETTFIYKLREQSNRIFKTKHNALF
jgi:hypothetical protein